MESDLATEATMREARRFDPTLCGDATRLALAAWVVSVAVLLTGGYAQAQSSTPVTACGTVLSAPGDYHLTGNLGPCSGHGVEITSNNVHLDLKGFTISGLSGPT